MKRGEFMNRRELLTGAVALSAAGVMANPLGMPIGCQTYPVRDAIGKDFEGTLKDLAGAGFQTIEMCSPSGYAAPNSKAGFGALADMKPADLKKKIEAAGLRCQSCHFQFKELRQNLDERIAFAKELGLTQMVLATFGVKPDAAMTAWTQAAEELNKIGEQTSKAGLQLVYHNHDGEFRTIDGTLVYDALMHTFDAKLVKMQFQTSVVSLGFEAATYFKKYPGRFISIHVSDWSSTEKKAVPVGQGVIKWKELFAAAKGAGVRNYFVEMNLDLMRASVPYLQKLK